MLPPPWVPAGSPHRSGRRASSTISERMSTWLKGFRPAALAVVLAAESVLAEGTAGAGEALQLKASRLGSLWGVPVTNSLLATWLVALVLVVFTQLAVRRASLVPGRLQGFLEMVLDGLLTFLAGLMGEDLARKIFWFLATLFLFILCANWCGLLPGFGTIGWGIKSAQGMTITRPLLRGADADVNLTFGIALLFSGYWLLWSVQAQGVGGFIWHLFGPKGGTPGVVGFLVGLVFVAVGILEVISIAFRPISLSLRLFGNIFAGETMMETLAHTFPMASWLVPVPFYFIELVVGLVQAAVFTLLAGIFTMLSCEHGDSDSAPHRAAAAPLEHA
jgi:F-type H+-transporting ATPase subunit a